ncbi:MAG: hypothetical protein R3C61_09865 [Bacteroidia bacterium]
MSFKNGLAISYAKLGETHTALGQLDRARAFFEDETQLFEQLYEAYPNNVEFKNNLAISYVKLASFYLDNDMLKAKDYLETAEKHFVGLHHISPQNAQFKQYLDIVQQVLEQLK